MLYPGIPDALAALVDRGARLIVATSKPTIYAERIIEHFGLGGSIRAVYGSELDGTLSDKAGLIAHVLESERLSRAATSMVGDRSHDMIGARANEVIPVGVLWGYGSREELESSGASALCERPVELTEVLSAKSALEAGRARPPRAGNAAR